MKILFIFKSENFLVPIGMCTISAVAKAQGHETFLSEMNSSNTMETVNKLQPDIIAYSSSSGESKHYLKINNEIKKKYPNVFTIMGGPHATFYPEVVDESSLDAVCIGEGEQAFVEVLDAIQNKRTVDSIKNIRTKTCPDSGVRDLVQDLDSIPIPDYGLFYDHTDMGKYPLKGFITSRGCPYSCSYCFNAAWRKIYHNNNGALTRKNSVDYVINNVKYVKDRWPLSCVKFQDDIFTARSDAWLDEFVVKYKKEIDLPFFILTRCDLLTEDMVKKLKEAGCRTISMSIEAGDPDVRLHRLNRKMDNQQIIDAHLLCDKYDIATFTNCIFGIPNTSLKEDIESLDLCLQSKATWAEFPIFYPFPRTELGDYAVAEGMYVPDYNNMHTSYQNTSILNCFTDREKEIQMNFGLLASVAVVFPAFRNFIVNKAIYWKTNKFFTFSYWISKNYVLRRFIYPTKTNFWESIKIYSRSLKQELFRHTFKEKV